MDPTTLKFIKHMTKPEGVDRSSADLILDTNVVVEIYSLGDLLRVIDEKGLDTAIVSPKLGYRRHRMKHSLVLAWWLAGAGIPTSSLGAEHIEKMVTSISPPNSLSFLLTIPFVHIIRDLVLGSWKFGALVDVDHYRMKASTDDEILRRGKDDATPIVTWEGYEEGSPSGLVGGSRLELHRVKVDS